MPNLPWPGIGPGARRSYGRSYVVFGVLGLIGAAVLAYLVFMLPWWLALKDEEEWDRNCCQPTPTTSALRAANGTRVSSDPTVTDLAAEMPVPSSPDRGMRVNP